MGAMIQPLPAPGTRFRPPAIRNKSLALWLSPFSPFSPFLGKMGAQIFPIFPIPPIGGWGNGEWGHLRGLGALKGTKKGRNQSSRSWRVKP